MILPVVGSTMVLEIPEKFPAICAGVNTGELVGVSARWRECPHRPP
jgi:hypothetical protein